MITIIHGTDISTSRKYFLDLKQKFPEQSIIDGKKISITDLTQIFEGGELFSEQRNFFFEGLFGKKSKKSDSITGKKSKEFEAIIDYLKKSEETNNIVLWEDTELTKTSIGLFKNPIIKLFKLPQVLFVFLDSIKPGNGKELIKLFHESIQNADAEMVFFMIIRQIRILLALTEVTSDNIEEVKRIAPWQKSKLQNQADLFEINELIKLYAKLFEIEKAMKTGNLTTSLPQTIDFLLLDI